MNNKWLQNPLILALLIFIPGIIIDFILIILFRLFGINLDSPIELGFVIVAFGIGYFYTKKTEQIIPKKLKIKSVLLFFVVSFIVSFVIIYLMSKGESMVLLFAVGFSILMILIECIFIYWFLSYGGKTYLKNSKKNKQ